MVSKRFLNSCEQQVYNILSPFEFVYCFKVFPKVKLADVLEIRGSGLDAVHYEYAKMAHFDFVVVQDNFVKLAIEIDGPDHFLDEDTSLRDLKKNSICKHFGFELLRIDSGYLNEVGGYFILSFLLQDYLSRHNPENKRNSRASKQMFASIKDGGVKSCGRLRDLEVDSISVCERFRRIDAEISSITAEENGFFYAAKILKVGDNEFCVGQGSAHPSSVISADAKQLADCLSLVELGRKVKLYEQNRLPAKSDSYVARIQSTYDASAGYPQVRRLVVRSYSTRDAKGNFA